MKWILFALTIVAVFGCSDAAPPVAGKEQKVKGIVSKSGGNWNRLSDADRQTLIQELGHGNEQTAKFSFDMRVSSDQAAKGGTPQPGGSR